MIEKSNEAFKKLKSKCGNNVCQFNINDLNHLFNKKIKKIKDVSFLVNVGEERNWKSVEENLDDTIKKFYTDKTGIEVSTNEIRIKDDIKTPDIPIEVQLELSIVLMNNLRDKENFPDKSVFYIWGDDEEIINLRFHELRKEEPLWWGDTWVDSPYPYAYYLYD